MSTINPESIEISTIKLNINGLVVELKVEQARELWRKLDEIFGPKPVQWVWTYNPAHQWDGPQETSPFPNPYQLTCDPIVAGDRVTCNAYTGNTLELR